MILYRIEAQTLAGNPLKMREYLAAGTPIATTDVPSLAPYRSLIAIAETPCRFADAIVAAREPSDRIEDPVRIRSASIEQVELPPEPTPAPPTAAALAADELVARVPDTVAGFEMQSQAFTFEQIDDLRRRAVPRCEEHRDARWALANRVEDLDTVDLGHGDVEHHEAGGLLGDHVGCCGRSDEIDLDDSFRE